MIRIFRVRLTPLQFLSMGFMLVIAVGTLLLALPFASRDGRGIPMIDALFTATSATCVTGLAVYDTYTQFAPFGQAVLITLIQIGGLGFMMIGVLFSMALRKRIGLRERALMKESINALKLGGIVRLVRRAFWGTAVCEVIGAVLLAFRFIPEFGVLRGLWFAVFHSVSAFCNAGFDLIGIVAPGTSLMRYSGDVLVNLVIMALIVVGGVGFIVWDDVLDNRWHLRKYRLQTKIVLSMTALLLVFATIGFYFMEAEHAFAGMSRGQRLLAAMFQSVTTRTAGFASVDMSKLSQSGSALTMLLMVIGASPGSTGGGTKTTTFFVMIFSVVAYVRSRDSINVYQRKIEDAAVLRAYNSTMLYLLVAVAGTLIVTLQGIQVDEALFEAISAIGTVGLSKGITAKLSPLSKCAIAALMYAGRLGSLTLAMAVADRRIKTSIKNIEEKIIIG